jgi:hypothetical protein
MIKSKTKNYGNEAQLLVSRIGYDEDGKPVFEKYEELLENFKIIQKEYPNFDIAILDVTSERRGVAPRGGYPLFYICRENRVWQEFRVGKYSLDDLRSIIRTNFQKIKDVEGSFANRTRTTIFCENHEMFFIYNDGIFLRKVDEEFDLMDLARKNIIDLYFEKFETNYGGFHNNYPEKMSEIFDWYRNSKNEERLNFIHENIHRPPQYQEKNFIEEPVFVKESENIETIFFLQGSGRKIYRDGIRDDGYTCQEKINPKLLRTFRTNYAYGVYRQFPKKASEIFDWYEKNKDKEPKIFLELEKT